MLSKYHRKRWWKLLGFSICWSFCSSFYSALIKFAKNKHKISLLQFLSISHHLKEIQFSLSGVCKKCKTKPTVCACLGQFASLWGALSLLNKSFFGIMSTRFTYTKAKLLHVNGPGMCREDTQFRPCMGGVNCERWLTKLSWVNTQHVGHCQLTLCGLKQWYVQYHQTSLFLC